METWVTCLLCKERSSRWRVREKLVLNGVKKKRGETGRAHELFPVTISWLATAKIFDNQAKIIFYGDQIQSKLFNRVHLIQLHQENV